MAKGTFCQPQLARNTALFHVCHGADFQAGWPARGFATSAAVALAASILVSGGVMLATPMWAERTPLAWFCCCAWCGHSLAVFSCCLVSVRSAAFTGQAPVVLPFFCSCPTPLFPLWANRYCPSWAAKPTFADRSCTDHSLAAHAHPTGATFVPLRWPRRQRPACLAASCGMR